MRQHEVICPVLVGRVAPLAAVHNVLSRTAAGEGRAVVITGEAGIGKSRLLREAAARARDAGFVVLEGACFEADRGTPYAPLLDLVRAFAKGSSPAVAAHTFAPAASALVAAFPELQSMFPDHGPIVAHDPQQSRRQLFHAIESSLLELGRTQPVLVSIEDAHWADDATLDLLSYLARGISTHPLTMLASYRSDEVSEPLHRLLHELDRWRLISEIPLTRLSLSELEQMLAAIFDGSAPGGDFVDRLHALTDGNPFFVEEVLKSLVTSGDVSLRADGTWHARPLARIEAPRTALDAVRRRLASLPFEAREIASVAAIVGRRFDFSFLQTLTGHDERALLRSIRELIAAQLVTEEAPDRFAFRHAITRDALVGELLARERATIHRRVADALQNDDARGDSNIEALAYHAYGAMEWSLALRTSIRAAEHALTLYAPREALAHLDRALDSAGRASIEPTPALFLARGRAFETLGEFQRAHECFADVISRADALGDAASVWEGLYALGRLWSARDYERAGAYRQHCLARARAMNDRQRTARSLNLVANWYVNVEYPAPALRGQHEALALFQQIGDERGVLETLDLLGMTHFIAGDMAAATRHFEEAAARYDALNDPRAFANSAAMLMPCQASMHSADTPFGAATAATDAQQTDRALRLTREIGWRAGEAFVLYLLGDVATWRGEYERAFGFARESLAIAESMDHLQWQCGASRVLGMLLLDLHLPARALGPLERAYYLAHRTSSRTWVRWTAAPFAIALAMHGEYERADLVLSEAAAPSALGLDALRAGDADHPTLGERMLVVARAVVALESGMPQRALEIFEHRLSAESGPVPKIAFLRARALLAAGRGADALEAFADARVQAEASGAAPLLWQIDAYRGATLRALKHRADARAALDAARDRALALAAKIPDAAVRLEFELVIDRMAPSAPAPTQRQRAKAKYGGLTARERDVARLVAHGKANRAIARVLGIGERTVESYVAGATSKLGYSSRAQLAAWAVAQGLVRDLVRDADDIASAS